MQETGVSQVLSGKTKNCRVCGKTKPTSDFYKDSRYRHGVKNLCKSCQNEERNVRRKKRKDWVQALKVEKGCVDCGYKEHPEALQFDHLPCYEKEYVIAALADSAQSRYVDEIKKCDVVCANCHAIRTHKRRSVS